MCGGDIKKLFYRMYHFAVLIVERQRSAKTHYLSTCKSNFLLFPVHVHLKLYQIPTTV